MVEVKGYELNHLYNLKVEAPAIGIGAFQVGAETPLELFSRKLAFSNDLQRVPILRGFSGSWKLEAPLFVQMQTAGINVLRCRIDLYNHKEAKPEYKVGSWMAVAFQQGGIGISVEFEPIEENIQGGVLLNPDVLLTLSLQSDKVVAGGALVASTIEAEAIMEIDWVPMNKKQMDDYMREFLFAEEQ